MKPLDTDLLPSHLAIPPIRWFTYHALLNCFLYIHEYSPNLPTRTAKFAKNFWRYLSPRWVKHMNNVTIWREQKPSKVHKPCNIVYSKIRFLGILTPKFFDLPSKFLVRDLKFLDLQSTLPWPTKKPVPWPTEDSPWPTKYPKYSSLSLINQVQFFNLPRLVPWLTW